MSSSNYGSGTPSQSALLQSTHYLSNNLFIVRTFSDIFSHCSKISTISRSIFTRTD